MAIEDNPKVSPTALEHKDTSKESTSLPSGDNLKVSSPSGKDKDLNEKGFLNRPRAGGKTIWDWLNLLGVLAVPIVVVLATIWFGFLQADLAQKQHDSDQQIANQQHAIDQQNALDQQHATTLQTYIDNIQDLLLHNNLRESKPNGEVVVLARARTLIALQGLDAARKGRLVQFLYEAQLIGFFNDKSERQGYIINLRFADLIGADLRFAILSFANLGGADLGGADLGGATLILARLSFANLHGADLNKATLSGANLIKADLGNANLIGADLRDADLRFATLGGAILSYANLSGATLSQQQLDQVSSCTGATLPTGLICHKNP